MTDTERNTIDWNFECISVTTGFRWTVSEENHDEMPYMGQQFVAQMFELDEYFND